MKRIATIIMLFIISTGLLYQKGLCDCSAELYLLEFVAKLRVNVLESYDHVALREDIRRQYSEKSYHDIKLIAESAIDDYTGGPYFSVSCESDYLIILKRYVLKDCRKIVVLMVPLMSIIDKNKIILGIETQIPPRKAATNSRRDANQ